jgi:transposase
VAGKRLQEVTTHKTMTRSLLAMADRLRELGMTRGGHGGNQRLQEEPFYLLEAHGFEVWLVNANDVKHLPGRRKTDRLDAVWLGKVAGRQMLRPSFAPHHRSAGCGTSPSRKWHLCHVFWSGVAVSYCGRPVGR